MAKQRDLEGLLRALNAIPASVRAAIEPAVEKGADEMVARMKFLAPDDPKTTGAEDLKSNIVKIRSDVPLAVRVQASVPGEFDHALAMEYGTSTNAASPFFWVSVNTTKKRVRRRIDRAISKAIKEGFAK